VNKSPDNKNVTRFLDLRVFLVTRACEVTMAAAEAKAQYSAIMLGATGNVGGRIVQLLIKNPLCKKVVVVTRRKSPVRRSRMRPTFTLAFGSQNFCTDFVPGPCF
jgi:NADPH:quinone reductase-like Zn-dependent oxidoreductase